MIASLLVQLTECHVMSFLASELELELIQTQMTQKPMLRASVFLSPVLLSLDVSLLVLSTECHALSFFSNFLSCLALSVLARFKTISNIFFFNCLLRLSLSAWLSPVLSPESLLLSRFPLSSLPLFLSSSLSLCLQIQRQIVLATPRMKRGNPREKYYSSNNSILPSALFVSRR